MFFGIPMVPCIFAPRMRNIAAILLGLIAGVFTITCVQWMGNMAFPADIPYPEKRADQLTYMQHVPTMAKWMIVFSYGIAGFVSGLVATFIQGRTNFRPALIATGTIQLLICMNMMSMPHPAWMWILTFLLVVPVGYLTYRKFRVRREQSLNP